MGRQRSFAHGRDEGVPRRAHIQLAAQHCVLRNTFQESIRYLVIATGIGRIVEFVASASSLPAVGVSAFVLGMSSSRTHLVSNRSPITEMRPPQEECTNCMHNSWLLFASSSLAGCCFWNLWMSFVTEVIISMMEMYPTDRQYPSGTGVTSTLSSISALQWKKGYFRVTRDESNATKQRKCLPSGRDP